MEPLSNLSVLEERCRERVERSLTLAPALAPIIGYDRAAEISKEAYQTGRIVREVAVGWGVLSPEELDAVPDAYRMTEPGFECVPSKSPGHHCGAARMWR